MSLGVSFADHVTAEPSETSFFELSGSPVALLVQAVPARLAVGQAVEVLATLASSTTRLFACRFTLAARRWRRGRN